MKKFVVALAALAMSACVLAGCSSSASNAPEPAPAPEGDATTLIVGFDAEYPPYGYIDNDGSYTGFDIELATEACARLGWTLDAQPIDWDAKDALIDSGAITCIWNGFTMEGREDSYAFSEPYMLNAQVIMVKADSGLKTLEDLAGKAVLTQADSAALAALEGEYAEANASFAGGAVAQIADYTNAVMQLESGAVDALACDYSIAMREIVQNPDKYEIIVDLGGEHYAVGFKMDNQAMADQITAVLKEMAADGTVSALIEKYAPQGIEAINWCLGELK